MFSFFFLGPVVVSNIWQLLFVVYLQCMCVCDDTKDTELFCVWTLAWHLEWVREAYFKEYVLDLCAKRSALYCWGFPLIALHFQENWLYVIFNIFLYFSICLVCMPGSDWFQFVARKLTSISFYYFVAAAVALPLLLCHLNFIFCMPSLCSFQLGIILIYLSLLGPAEFKHL